MASKVLVCGSGCIGLRTAVELLRRNVSVHLRSARPPLDPSTCSVGAGGLWMPYHCEDDRVDKWAAQTLDELLSYQSTSGGDSPVEIVPTVVLKRHHHGPTVKNFIKNDERLPNEVDDDPLPAWTNHPRLDFQHLAVEMLAWQNKVHKLRIPSEAVLKEAGYMHAWMFRPPIVDAPRMLNSMMLDVEMHPLTVDVNTETEYESLEHMVEDAKSLGCDSVVNCTGLGARDLCDDEQQLVGGRGVLLHYDRMCERRPDPHGAESFPNDAAILVEEPPWASETETSYMIPRGDALVVGGTYLEGDTETNVRQEERERLTKNAWRLGIDTGKVEPIDSWVGFRPARPTTRLEVDASVGDGGVNVVHNYGHGGSGWTVFVGAAKEAASLVVG